MSYADTPDDSQAEPVASGTASLIEEARKLLVTVIQEQVVPLVDRNPDVVVHLMTAGSEARKLLTMLQEQVAPLLVERNADVITHLSAVRDGLAAAGTELAAAYRAAVGVDGRQEPERSEKIERIDVE